MSGPPDLKIVQDAGGAKILTAEELAAKNRIESIMGVDAEKVRWTVARMQKAAGKVPVNVYMTALCIMVGQQIVQAARPKHPMLMNAFVEQLNTAVLLTYPREVIQQMRDAAEANMEAERLKAVDAIGEQLADQMQGVIRDIGKGAARIEPGNDEPTG